MPYLVRDFDTLAFHNKDSRIANQSHQQTIFGGQHIYL